MFEKGIDKLEKEIGADAKKGEDILDRAFSDKPMPKAKPKAKAKAKAKPKAKKKTSVSKADAEKELAKKVGKTEEECEDILKQFRDLRAKKKARTKKTSETKAKSKAQGKTEPSGEITPEAVINDATKKVEKKIDKKIEKVEAKAEKTEKPKADATPKAKKEAEKKVEKKVEKETKVVAKDSVDALEGMVKAIMDSLKKYDKATAKLSLIKLRDAIDKEIAKYGDGGMVQGFDIQASLINVGNNPSYAKGGSVKDYEKGKWLQGKQWHIYKGDSGWQLERYKGDNLIEQYSIDVEDIEEYDEYDEKIDFISYSPNYDGEILIPENVQLKVITLLEKVNPKYNFGDEYDNQINANQYSEMYAKGGTLDVPNLNDGDFVETYAEGGSLKRRAERLAKKDGKDLDKVSDEEYMKYRMMAQEQVSKLYKAEGGRLDMELLDYNIGGALAVASQVKGVAPKSVDGIDSYLGNKFKNKAKMDDWWNTSPNERKARGYEKGGKVDVVDERSVGKMKIIIMNDGKSSRTITFKDGVENKFNRNEQEDIDKLWELSSKVPFGTIIDKKYKFAKGGMSQGYNDKDDESIGMRNRGNKMQSRKDRRDESAGMEKSGGRRKYADVGTMDKGRRKKMEAGGGLGNIAKPFNIQEGMISVGNNVKFFKKGGGLYDNLKIKKGTFTKKAKNRGMTTKAFMKEVLSNPENYTMKTRRQAQLMKNMM